MFHGAFALLERSLRIDARNWPTHLCRLGLVGSIYVSLCFALSTQNRFGAPGLRFFQGIAFLDLAFITLLGLSYFSTSITEEKEEDTLGLMLMAGVSPLGILAGKSIGRFWQAILLVAAQYPFMLLAVTMGGVTTLQVQAITLALVAYMVFLAGMGLLCSTLASRNRTASSMMIVGLSIYFLVPLIAKLILIKLAKSTIQGVTATPSISMWRAFLESMENLCIYLKMGEILTTGFGQSIWSFQVISNVLLGFVLSGLAWLLFGTASLTTSTEASSRGLVARQRAFLHFNAGRPWPNPFVWKDFHFVSGGIGTIFVRFGFYLSLCLIVFGFDHFLDASFGPNGAVGLCQMLLSLAIAIDAAMALAQAMHDEIRSQTLAALLMLPQSPVRIVYSKFLGSLLGWFPGPLVLLAVTMTTVSGRSDFYSLLQNEHGGWCVVLLFLLPPHFAPLAALIVRWGAVAVAFGLTIGVYFGIIMGISLFRGPSDAFFASAALVMTTLCVVCHLLLLVRIQTLAMK
ncbi:ABC transporter permease subunit [Schlesneria sp. DSM 10557]|uniref:ABC transporter permease subunit n=1 Tax=Schlesneria sp. DSM 10557 TaxID=3044399 RepID=UPI0035A154AE